MNRWSYEVHLKRLPLHSAYTNDPPSARFNFTISSFPDPLPHYCISLKMLSSFFDYFGALLVSTNPLNEEFRLHFLLNFLIILTYPSTILLHPFLHFPLRCPSVVLCATGRPPTTPSLPPLVIWQPIGDPAAPVGMVRRLLRSVAIATYPAMIDSPRSPRGP